MKLNLNRFRTVACLVDRLIGNAVFITLTLIFLLFILTSTACSSAGKDPEIQTGSTVVDQSTPVQVTPSLTVMLTDTLAPMGTITPTITKILTATASPLPTSTSTISPTPDPYEEYTIEHLANRSYGGEGELVIEGTLAENSYFTRYEFSYPSDGLTIYGFMNVPKVDETTSSSAAGRSSNAAADVSDRANTDAVPVVIALHGYIDPAIYNTIDYTTRYADALARAGYLVLHPNLRNYPPSDDGDNLFRVGMAIDVLNLITLVKDGAGESGPLGMADTEAIGLWGHSMGGGISTRVMTASPDVGAVVLYGAMSGDDQKNFERIYSYFSNGQRGLEELAAPPDAFQRISPVNYLDRVQAAVSIHHGKADGEVPLAWSLETCRRLRDLDVQVECFTYDDQPHTFYGEDDALFMLRMVEFYNRVLRGE